MGLPPKCYITFSIPVKRYISFCTTQNRRGWGIKKQGLKRYRTFSKVGLFPKHNFCEAFPSLLAGVLASSSLCMSRTCSYCLLPFVFKTAIYQRLATKIANRPSKRDLIDRRILQELGPMQELAPGTNYIGFFAGGLCELAA